MKSKIVAFALLAIASASSASVLKTESSATSLEGINIAQSGTFTMKGQTHHLKGLGYGLRKKKIAILKVKIYVAELLASSPEKFVRDSQQALTSLNLSSTIAIRLNFVYSVDGQTIKAAFSDALKVNNIDLAEAAMAKTLDVISKAGEFKSGEAITFVAQKEDNGTETLYFENPRGVVAEINGNSGFSQNFFSLWLGKNADEQTAELKAQLIKGF